MKGIKMVVIVVELGQLISLLEEIKDDRTVPRNIRSICDEAQLILGDDTKETSVKVDSVRQLLDRISEDPNLPVYTRTQVWNIVSLLESL
jgi:uncharacterized protein (UPF0147 family)